MVDKTFTKKNTLASKLKSSTKEDDIVNAHNVKKNSDDWRFVEFHLKSVMPYDTEIKKITTIFNTHMKASFDKAAKNKLTTYAWISSNILDASNSLSRLRTRGKFDMPPHGLDFSYGCLFDDYSFVEIESHFILCKIIIGRSFCKMLRDKNEFSNFILEGNQKNYLPEGYESIMFCPANAFNQSTTTMQLGYKTIRYRIYDAMNILPMFCVNFLPQAYHLNIYYSKKVCDECTEKEADYFCSSCEFNFCQDCYSLVHHEYSNDKSLKAMFSNHVGDVIVRSNAGLCDCSNSKEAEFYCKTCLVPLCAYCKLLGAHSKGEMSSHQLEEIYTYYQRLNPDNNELIKITLDKARKAQETLGKLKIQINSLRENIFYDSCKQLESVMEKEYNHTQLVSIGAIHSNISKMNLLNVIKDKLLFTSDYFNSREQLVKTSYLPEYIYNWSSFSREINHFSRNIDVFITKNKYPDRKDHEQPKFNEFKVIPYSFDDSTYTKEKGKEEATKLPSSVLKQVFDKNQQKINIYNTNLLKKMINQHATKVSNANYDNSKNDVPKDNEYDAEEGD